jgi:hypothetical protein
MFLEKEQANLWTLDGPNSIYDREMDASVSLAMKISRMKMIIKLVPQIASPGQTIEITHTLSIGEGNAFHGCFGSRNWWWFESQSSNVHSKLDDDAYFPNCLEELSLESGTEVNWKQAVTVPLDVAIGDARVRARIMILGGAHCREEYCRYAFIDSEPAILQIVRPSTCVAP